MEEKDNYRIKLMVNYKQYKDCFNHIRSHSKNWGDTTIKLCTLEIEDKRIFSNFLPVTQRDTINYIQFYSVDLSSDSLQEIYPFRMDAIYTNDTFEINGQGELITSSLFNFICYFQLAPDIHWTFYAVEGDGDNDDDDDDDVRVGVSHDQ